MPRLNLLLIFCFLGPALIGQGKKKNKRKEVTFEESADRVIIQNLNGINTPYIEFSPAFYRNGLVFVTSRQRGGYYDPKLNTTYFELFYAKLNQEGTPFKPRPFSLELNSKYHEGPVSFTADENLMFFSRNNVQEGMLIKGKNGGGKIQIFQATRGIFDWENIQLLPFNSNDFNSMHPSINAEGNKLYFSSDRPGGFGGMDIYVAEFMNGKWMEPINLGPDINTPKNEVFPFIHPSGILIFSSDGHKGYGGLDLFLIDISKRKWGQLVNIGGPFNSNKDDFGFIMNPTSTQGFFSSNRDRGIGKDDIYYFTAPDGLEGVKVAKQIIARVTVVDAKDKSPLAGAKVRLFLQTADGRTKDGGIYDMELLPSADGENGFTMVESRRSETVLGAPEAILDKEGYAVLTLDPKKKYLLLIDKPGYKSLEYPLNINPTEAYYPVNIELERLDCITLYGTIKSEGYNNVIPNATIKVANSCSTEITTLSATVEGSFEYCLETNCKYMITASKRGFEDDVKQLTTISLRGSRSFNLDFKLPSSLKPKRDKKQLLEEGMVIYLEGITYDFNKSAIRKGAARDLEALAALMQKYKSIKVELGAHTDSRGTDEYNLALSKARAVYAKDYLSERGINSKRIQTKGYGESKLRNECKDGTRCSEKEHAYNRRIEVKILKINEEVDLVAFNADLKSKP